MKILEVALIGVLIAELFVLQSNLSALRFKPRLGEENLKLVDYAETERFHSY